MWNIEFDEKTEKSIYSYIVKLKSQGQDNEDASVVLDN